MQDLFLFFKKHYNISAGFYTRAFKKGFHTRTTIKNMACKKKPAKKASKTKKKPCKKCK